MENAQNVVELVATEDLAALETQLAQLKAQRKAAKEAAKKFEHDWDLAHRMNERFDRRRNKAAAAAMLEESKQAAIAEVKAMLEASGITLKELRAALAAEAAQPAQEVAQEA